MDRTALEDVPDNLKAQMDSKGEASPRGHPKGDEGAEQTGSQFIAPAIEKSNN